MEILNITKDMLDAGNNYIGTVDVSNWHGHIEIGLNLGIVRFAKMLAAKGRIRASAGSGISAGWGISAGEGISAGWGISAGEGISAGWGISAGSGISAGDGISAGWGISAGLAIVAKLVSAKLRIFAGVCMWRIPSQEESQVRAIRMEGTLAFGEFVKTEEADAE